VSTLLFRELSFLSTQHVTEQVSQEAVDLWRSSLGKTHVAWAGEPRSKVTKIAKLHASSLRNGPKVNIGVISGCFGCLRLGLTHLDLLRKNKWIAR